MRYLISLLLLLSGCAIFSTSIRECASLCKGKSAKHFKDGEVECACEVDHE